jgi:hypothetical protein
VVSRLHAKLKEKRWEHKDITKTLDALKKASLQQRRHVHNATVITALLVMGIGNILAALVLVPLMLGLQGWFLYAMVMLLGIGMGMLFDTLTRSIESLETEHHLLFSLVMPFLALISVLFMAVFANDAASSFGIRNVHNPYTVAFLYAAAFLLPYAYAKFVLKKHYYSG